MADIANIFHPIIPGINLAEPHKMAQSLCTILQMSTLELCYIMPMHVSIVKSESMLVDLLLWWNQNEERGH